MSSTGHPHLTALGSPRSRPSTPAPAGTPARTAILLATRAGEARQPAALLRCETTTVLGRLLDQLAGLDVAVAHVITRPGWERAIAAAVDGCPLTLHVRSSADARTDLRAIAEVARAGDGPLVLLDGDIVLHRQALAGILADPRGATTALTTTGVAGGPDAPRARIERGRLVSAGSPLHTVGAPTASVLGVVRVARADRGILAGQAKRLAALAGERQAELGPGHDDAVALALVGLVRGGAPVGAGYLRSFHWVRPTTTAEVDQATAAIAQVDEDDILLSAAVKATDGFFTTFFVSPYSKHIARWAARRTLTPNQITTASLFVGALAAAAFAVGERWGLIAGAILLQAAFALDCVDGQLARYTRQFSKLGAWLDSVFDRTKEYLVFAGLAIGAAVTGDPVWLLAGAALALQTVRHTLDFSFAAAQHLRLGAHVPVPLGQVDDGVAPAGAAVAAPSPPPRGLGARIRGARRRLNRWSGVGWAKRIVAFPIGERFAAISLTAALWSPEVVFLVLLAWGGVAALYAMPGRLARSLRA